MCDYVRIINFRIIIIIIIIIIITERDRERRLMTETYELTSYLKELLKLESFARICLSLSVYAHTLTEFYISQFHSSRPILYKS